MTPDILPLHSLRSLKKTKLICIFGKPVNTLRLCQGQSVYSAMHMLNTCLSEENNVSQRINSSSWNEKLKTYFFF